MGRIAVIGDVGGHSRHLREALTSLGATGENLRLPGDLTVIQVGDLVDRGPDSTGVLDLVDGYLRDQPEQWVQLVGNHEAQYLPGGTAFWRGGSASMTRDAFAVGGPRSGCRSRPACGRPAATRSC